MQVNNNFIQNVLGVALQPLVPIPSVLFQLIFGSLNAYD